MYEVRKTGSRPLKTGVLYPACSLLKCDPATGIYELVTSPEDDCDAMLHCGEDLRTARGDYCPVGMVLQGCANFDCVAWHESFSDADKELWRRKKNCCIVFEATYCGLPSVPDDYVPDDNKLGAKAADVAAAASTAKQIAEQARLGGEQQDDPPADSVVEQP